MNRLNADFVLAFVGLIWGFGFVAQKNASAHLGPFTFVACRFLISALFVLPFVLRERSLPHLASRIQSGHLKKIAALCAAFCVAVLVQQYGLTTTSVTNSAFITGMYIVLVPFVTRVFYAEKLTPLAVLACILSFAGVGLLTGADPRHLLTSFHVGDGFVLLCALGFALQVSIMGHIAAGMKMPCLLSLLQYMVTGIVALGMALGFEVIDLHAIADSWLSILYAGVAAGGIAYTLQAVAQQHTPSVDTAVILSTESLFGAVGGAWLLHERISFMGYLGCGAIMLSILLVELVPYLRKKAA